MQAAIFCGYEVTLKKNVPMYDKTNDEIVQFSIKMYNSKKKKKIINTITIYRTLVYSLLIGALTGRGENRGV